MEVTLFSTRYYSPLRLRAALIAHYYYSFPSLPIPVSWLLNRFNPQTEENADLCGFDWFRFLIGILGSLGTVAVYFCF
jgi:ABC-type spermidine/putrescine transport system permease subunit II